ncbi:MAG: hypothetical protein HY080_04970 [Gammaproteobacteria bacterium]|nr:hypothetical protein [Gammaproteobacteria bacterium]
MPYYVYRINHGPTALFKNLELLQEYAGYKEAQQFAKDTRTQVDADPKITIKVMFANNPLEAEEKLMEVREQPIIREWEK